jgi:hypothetical protein
MIGELQKNKIRAGFIQLTFSKIVGELTNVIRRKGSRGFFLKKSLVLS